MWYRLAQQTSLKYNLVMDPNKTTATFTSPIGKDGYPLYPTVNIILKFDNIIVKWWNKITCFCERTRYKNAEFLHFFCQKPMIYVNKTVTS